jgi:hypothetical protein
MQPSQRAYNPAAQPGTAYGATAQPSSGAAQQPVYGAGAYGGSPSLYSGAPAQYGGAPSQHGGAPSPYGAPGAQPVAGAYGAQPSPQLSPHGAYGAQPAAPHGAYGAQTPAPHGAYGAQPATAYGSAPQAGYGMAPGAPAYGAVAHSAAAGLRVQTGPSSYQPAAWGVQPGSTQGGGIGSSYEHSIPYGSGASPGQQQAQSKSPAMFAPSSPAPSVFDAISIPAPRPVTIGPIDGPGVTMRLSELQRRGLLSSQEYMTISPQAYLLPAKITLALDALEERGDRSGVFELMMQPAPAPVYHAPAPVPLPAPVPAPAPGASRASASGSSASSSSGRATGSASASSSKSGLWAAVKKAGKGGAESSSDEDSDEEDRKEAAMAAEDAKLARQLQQQFDQEDSELRPPHPAAGGFKTPLPGSFLLANEELLGKVLVRVSSKKLFRKWKEMFFSINKDRICLYESSLDYEARRLPRMVYRMHPCMYVRKPTVKHTYSMMDDGERVYYTVFRENITEEGSSTSYTGLPTAMNTYSFDARSQRICKFGAANLDEISAFAHALHGVILLKRHERAEKLEQPQQTGSISRYGA